MISPAILILADGTQFAGRSIGADGFSVGEVVFNTALTGYQEILTDPSYSRQLVTLTYPHIGNVGVNPEDQESDNVMLIPDGNGEFSEGMGMLVDKSDLCFGMRSWRYSMLVKDGVIEKMFIEPDVAGDPFEVSDADTMLAYINPQAKPARVATIFTKHACPYCAKAKAMLSANGISYEEILISNHGPSSKTLRAIAQASTVPQVFIEGELIGGSDDLEVFLAK